MVTGHFMVSYTTSDTHSAWNFTREEEDTKKVWKFQPSEEEMKPIKNELLSGTGIGKAGGSSRSRLTTWRAPLSVFFKFGLYDRDELAGGKRLSRRIMLIW